MALFHLSLLQFVWRKKLYVIKYQKNTTGGYILIYLHNLPNRLIASKKPINHYVQKFT